MASKVCRHCEREKDESDFPPQRRVCRDCNRIRNNDYSRRRNAKDRETVNARNAKWVAENLKQRKQQQKRYREENAERLQESAERCRRAKPVQYREAARTRAATRRATDLDFRLKDVLRKRVRNALLGTAKAETTMGLLGCSMDELRSHLEANFKKGMCWENHGIHGWHIDHKIPCSAFDLTDPEQQRKCFHFTNLQPLWAGDNWRKGNKMAA